VGDAELDELLRVSGSISQLVDRLKVTPDRPRE
jgi:hypothetical protein